MTIMQHPVPENHLTQIGDITVSFAMLESSIQSLAWVLLTDEQRIGQVVTAELSFRNLRALALSLYRERFGENSSFEELKELINRSGEIEDKRNQITHSVWAAGKDVLHITRVKTTAKEKKGLNFKFTETSIDDLAEVAKSIKQLASDITHFWIELAKD